MALKKFIGARYAPEFVGAWSNTKQYAALSVVYADNRSYVSRKTVPAGTAIDNPEFWIQSSDWNAQVAEYNLKADRFRIVPDQNKTCEESSRTRADYVLFHNTNVPFAYACAGDKFVEYNLKTRQQRTISLTAFPSPA